MHKIRAATTHFRIASSNAEPMPRWDAPATATLKNPSAITIRIRPQRSRLRRQHPVRTTAAACAELGERPMIAKCFVSVCAILFVFIGSARAEHTCYYSGCFRSLCAAIAEQYAEARRTQGTIAQCERSTLSRVICEQDDEMRQYLRNKLDACRAKCKEIDAACRQKYGDE